MILLFAVGFVQILRRKSIFTTYLMGMIGLTGGLSLPMSGTSSTLVRAVKPPRVQNVTWSAVTCGRKLVETINIHGG